MWPAIISFAWGLFKTFATSAVSSAGARWVASWGEQHAPQAVTAAQPGATREQQVSASQDILQRLRDDEQLREQARSILESHVPETFQQSQHVQRALEQSPDLVQQVVSGAKPVTDLLSTVHMWETITNRALTRQQIDFLDSQDADPFHPRCPVGGEDLGFDVDAVKYLDQFGQDHFMPSGLHGDMTAACKNGHRWAVFS